MPSQEAVKEASTFAVWASERGLSVGHTTTITEMANLLDKARREEQERCAAICLRVEFSHRLSGEKREADALAKASRFIAEGKFEPLPENLEAIRARP